MNGPNGFSALHRNEILTSLPAAQFDLLVIGGGIMGAGIALDAASRGMKVLLAEKQDFAAGTSSRSTKLIHGGLRYLKNLEFLLVRSVARERKVLHRNAPHLVLPEPMLIPVLRQNSFGFWPTAAGLTLYDFLGNVSGDERHKMLSAKAALRQEPLLNPVGLKGAGLFYEYRSDDARLTTEVLKTAVAQGAACINYLSVQHLVYSGNQVCGAVLKDEFSGQTYEVKCRCVINAAGPWVGQFLEKDQQNGAPKLFHTKGVHLVVPFNRLPLHQSIYFDIPGGRMLFAIPRNDKTYLGTTDTPFSGDLANPLTDKADAAYLLDQINRMFPGLDLTPQDVESSWAGVRTLVFEAGKKPSQISRKDEIITAASGLISVAGGKLTGYRPLAEKVVNLALNLKFSDRKWPSSLTKTLVLCGGNFTSKEAVPAFLKNCQEMAKAQNFAPGNIAELVRTYGTNASLILKKAAEILELKPQEPEALLKAEIWYSIHFESTLTLSDFLIRRTGKLYFDRPVIPEILPTVKIAFQDYLHLSPENLKQQENAFLKQFEAVLAFRN